MIDAWRSIYCIEPLIIILIVQKPKSFKWKNCIMRKQMHAHMETMS